ncbi:hypothetical protein [uncultured Microbulbifer sp.]|uniref:hypothetical protein n=1 Tax=uncultured Microbulbifer sp. TaxID=348147 RepID=UPI0026202554|nr:hypothetical protein [uncultured Microbulbifer sp.]
MSQSYSLQSVSEENLSKILENECLIFRLHAPEDTDEYLERLKENRPKTLIQKFKAALGVKETVPKLNISDLERKIIPLESKISMLHDLIEINMGWPEGMSILGSSEISLSIDVGWVSPYVITPESVKLTNEFLCDHLSDDIFDQMAIEKMLKNGNCGKGSPWTEHEILSVWKDINEDFIEYKNLLSECSKANHGLLIYCI